MVVDRAAPPDASERGIFRTRGHPRAVEAIRAMVRGRLPHAILIGGPTGIGKTTLALDLAAGLLCDDPDPAARPCRGCRGCRLVDRGIHPDLHRLAPTGPGDQIRIGSRLEPEEGTVRRLALDLALMPVEGGARVAIIERAEQMGDDAQTALLKTLEEPPAGVTIVLCADDEDRLMPTVRSRCARIRLGPVPVRDIEAILGDAGAADPPLAARLARLAGGRPGLAASLARVPDAVAIRDEIARTLLDLVRVGPAERLSAARSLLGRASDLDRAMRDTAADTTPAAPTRGSTVAGGPSRRGSGRRSGVAPGPALAPASSDVATTAVAGPASRTAASEEAVDDDGEQDQASDAGRRAAQPASERRRAGAVLVGLWREVTRDLLVVALGSEREVRDPALLDDLRATSDLLGTAGPDRDAASVTASHGDGASVAAGLTAFLARLDGAGELLAANVRAEIIVDTLVLGWPRARAASSSPATGPAAARGRASP
jgi:DNA polymerase III delta' subunit